MAIKAIIFDMDGVIYRGKALIQGAKEKIHQLRKKGIRVFYLTNAGTRSRKMRAQKIREMGIEVEDTEVYTASYASAKYVSETFGKPTVFSIGEAGMVEELANFGISVTDDERADLVVVGLDRHVNYGRLGKAFRAIHNGAKFVANNTDATFPVEDGFMPGAGALVSFLEFSTGRKPIVIGKPNTYMVEMILKDFGLKRAEVMIVGDRLESDIAAGKKAKIKTCLVLSGVAKKEDLKKLSKNEKPDFVIDSIADIDSIL